MTELYIGSGLFALAWLGAIQGDRKMFGLPIWDGTVKSLVAVPPTPIHPSQAHYSATVRGHGYSIPTAPPYASHLDSSSATLASSSSRFDCNTFLFLLFVAMSLLTALSCSLYLVHQYYIDEALEVQAVKWSGAKRSLGAKIAKLEEESAGMQDEVRSEWTEEKRSLCAKIANLEEKNAALQDKFHQRLSEEVEQRIKRSEEKRPLYPKIRDLELEISKLQDTFQRRVDEEVKSRVEYLSTKVQELNSLPKKNEDLRAENTKLKLLINGGLPVGGLNPQDWTAKLDDTPPASTTTSAKARPHWHQNVKLGPGNVRLPQHSPASASKHPPSSSTPYIPPPKATATKEPPIPHAASATTAIINAEKLAMLKELGMPAPQARKALREADGDVVDAMEWAFDHPDDLGNLAEYDEDNDSTGVPEVDTKSPLQSPQAISSDKGKMRADKNDVDEKLNDQAAGASDSSPIPRLSVPTTIPLHHPLPPKPPVPTWLTTPTVDATANPTSQGKNKDGVAAVPAQKAGQPSIIDPLPTAPPRLSPQPTTSHSLPTRIPAPSNTQPPTTTVPAKPVADGPKLENPNIGRTAEVRSGEEDEPKEPSGQPTGLPTPTGSLPNVKPDINVVPIPVKPAHGLPARPPMAADMMFGFNKSRKARAASDAKTSKPAPTTTPLPSPPPGKPEIKDDEACKGTSTEPGKEHPADADKAQESTSGANAIQPTPPTTSPPPPPADPKTEDDEPGKEHPADADKAQGGTSGANVIQPTPTITSPPSPPSPPTTQTNPCIDDTDAQKKDGQEAGKRDDGEENENEETGSMDGEKKKRKRRRKKRTGYPREMTAEEWACRVEGGEQAPEGNEKRVWW